MNVVKTLKGGSLSGTFVMQHGRQKVVRKSISKAIDREYGLVRWQSQIRKMQILENALPKSTVPILRLGETDDQYFYDMPFYEDSTDAYAALLAGEDVEDIAEAVLDLLSGLASVSFGSSKGAMSVYISEEMHSPMKQAILALENGTLGLSEAEAAYFLEKLDPAISLIANMILDFKDREINETLSHGNMTLENLLWDPHQKKLFIIDPYAETYCETIMGDVSQLLQSSLSGYEFVSEMSAKSEVPLDKYPNEQIPTQLSQFKAALLKGAQTEIWYDESLLHLLHASQFTRMFPFKLVNAPRLGALFMLHAVDLLRKK